LLKGEVLRLIVFSHFEVGNYYYHVIRKNKNVSFKLRWGAFVFGNIFPDISKFAFVNHFYEDTISVYKCFQKKAGNPENTDMERSMALGVVCHFICDYFCKYHAKTPYTKQSMVIHMLYETLLHFKMKSILFKKTFGLLDLDEDCVFNTVTDQNGAAGSFDLLNMIREYEDQEESLLTDIVFSFGAVRGAVKEILRAETAAAEGGNNKERIPARRVIA